MQSTIIIAKDEKPSVCPCSAYNFACHADNFAVSLCIGSGFEY